MTADQPTKAAAFKELHNRDGAFIIPNPWDVGSARILESLGFEALATTSAGFAFSLGLTDGGVTAQQALDHCTAIVAASDLPVSADLERGFGDSPDAVAETIRIAADTGLVGCSIEDFSGLFGDVILGQGHFKYVLPQSCFQLVGSSAGDGLSAVDDHDVVAESICFLEILSSEQKGRTGADQGANGIPGIETSFWVQASCGFIQNENFRSRNDTGSNIQPSSHTARIGLCHPILRIHQPYLVQ